MSTLTFPTAFEFNPTDPSSANYWPAIFASSANWTQQSLSPSQWVVKGTAASGFEGWTVTVTPDTVFGPPSTPGGMPTGYMSSITVQDQNGVTVLEAADLSGHDNYYLGLDLSYLASNPATVFERVGNFKGSAGDDLYVGVDYPAYSIWDDSYNVTLSGGAGNDTLVGGTPNSLNSWLKAVVVHGDAGDDLIQGGNRRAVLWGDAGADTILGGAGLDKIYADGADVLIDGGAGGATVYLTSSAVVRLGGVAGPGEVLMRNVSSLQLSGEFAMDVRASADWTSSITVNTGAADDDVTTGSGDDVISFVGGSDFFDAGAGNDTLDIELTGTIDLRLTTPQDVGGGNFGTFINFENVAGARGTVWGTEGANRLSGTGTVYGLGGDDDLDAPTMVGGAGNDTYAVDGNHWHTVVVIEEAGGGIDTINLGAIGGSTVPFTWNLTDFVENLNFSGAVGLIGYGNDENNIITSTRGTNKLYGLNGDDTLYSGAGNDRLEGGSGRDALYGGAGNDTYQVGNGGDTVHENAGEGTDLVESTIAYTLAANVEKLTLMGTKAINGTGNDLSNLLNGNEAANVLSGLDGNDTVLGFDGDDTLYGGGGNDHLEGGSGRDAMYGGAGDDTYLLWNNNDSVHESAVEGIDLVLSTISCALAANVENLTLMGTAALNGTGNGLDNTLVGNSAANVIDGGGGVDILRGGAGNDTYIVDQAGDRLSEALTEGTDTVLASASYGLNGGYVENLTLTGTAAINGTGNTLDNVLIGNTAANRLDGKTGNDVMRGGKGDDTYVVGQTGDKVYELKDEGIDTVLSSISYDLTGQYIEKLTLTGTAAINGTGNTLDNVLTGNTTDNRLDGKTGVDKMYGGAGDDTYVVGQAGDKAYERAGEGIDTVLSSVSYDLGGQYVENLTLTGTAAIDATGNSLQNSLTGNNAANLLDGGAGNDILRGNGGNDIFGFSTSPTLVADPDIIRDFSNVSGNNDSIRLDHLAFTALSATGPLAAAAFKDLALGAKDSSDRIIYDSARGNLYYDADGTGAIQAVRFAHLDNHATLTNTDFSVI